MHWRDMGMTVTRIRRKTCVNERYSGGMMQLQGREVVKVEKFKYLGLPVSCTQLMGNGEEK